MTDSKLTVRISTTGRLLERIVDWTIDSGYLTSTDLFNFSAIPQLRSRSTISS